MQTLTKSIIEAGWSERVITKIQLVRLLSGSPQRLTSVYQYQRMRKLIDAMRWGWAG